jgi:hypothetical protein
VSEPEQQKLSTGLDLVGQLRLTIFHWMSVTLKLNHVAISGAASVSCYDGERLFQEIQAQQSPYQAWPEMIAKQLESDALKERK